MFSLLLLQLLPVTICSQGNPLRVLVSKTRSRTSPESRLRSQSGSGQKWLLFCQEGSAQFSLQGRPPSLVTVLSVVIETVFPFQLGSMDRHLNTRRVVWTEAGIFCQWPSPGEGRRRGDAFLSFAETRLPAFLVPCHFPSTKTHAQLETCE